MLLQNKNAVIWGGGAIGGGVARTFAREGAKVFLVGRSAEENFVDPGKLTALNLPLQRTLVLAVLFLLAASARAAPDRKAKATGARGSVGIGCVSVPRGWQVSLEPHDGWVSGQIQNPANAGVMAFAIVMGAGTPAASPARREQFEWLKTEKLGRALLHYGLERKSDGRPVLQATVIGGGVTANFVTPQRDDKSLSSLLAVARSYSPEKCPQ